MIVKICGITNAEDANAAVEGGATALGFNFYKGSPRYIEPERAGEIQTRGGVRRVGVFVNERPARIAEIAQVAGLDVAQLHGDETPADYPAGVAIWKAARVKAGFDLKALEASPGEALLLDGPGSGLMFDWRVAAESRRRVILAGGLDGHNVAAAVAIAHPWGVDACSRIEFAPGKKDHIKMSEFLQAARAAYGL
jgi:phosphoribosylanthranilate isomerase